MFTDFHNVTETHSKDFKHEELLHEVSVEVQYRPTAEYLL